MAAIVGLMVFIAGDLAKSWSGGDIRPRGLRQLLQMQMRRHRPDYWLLILCALLLSIGLVVVYAISPALRGAGISDTPADCYRPQSGCICGNYKDTAGAVAKVAQAAVDCRWSCYGAGADYAG